jgi:crotonobetainyl-CoA:carnitine CoA-transferase CaiB-like acyl-CoA transferase
MPYKKILEGTVVLDFTQFVASSLAARILADMGAEVLKVERYPVGDLLRPSGVIPIKNSSGMFLIFNVGKKSLCVDFHNPEGISLVKNLVPHVDVVLEGYSPGQMKTYGLDYESLKQIKPDMVYGSFTAFGHDGPYRDWVAFNTQIEGMSGLAYTTGLPNESPLLPGFGIGDPNAGIHDCLAILAALMYRDRTGIGQFVETSMLDSLMLMGSPSYAVALTDGEANPGRWGRHRDGVVPYGVYECQGEFLILEVIGEGENSMWGRFCRAIGSPDMITDPRFDTNTHRVANREETIRRIQGWFDRQPSNLQAAEYLQKHRVACAPVLSPRQVILSDYARKRELLTKVYHPEIGEEASVLNIPYKFSKTPLKVESGAPFLGQHNEYILEKYLSYSGDQIKSLYDRKVLFKKSPPPP